MCPIINTAQQRDNFLLIRLFCGTIFAVMSDDEASFASLSAKAEELGIPIRRLCVAIGIGKSTYYRYATDSKPFTLETARRFQAFLRDFEARRNSVHDLPLGPDNGTGER